MLDNRIRLVALLPCKPGPYKIGWQLDLSERDRLRSARVSYFILSPWLRPYLPRPRDGTIVLGLLRTD